MGMLYEYNFEDRLLMNIENAITVYDLVTSTRLQFTPAVKLVEPGISAKIVEDENGNPIIEFVETPPRIVPSFDVKPID